MCSIEINQIHERLGGWVYIRNPINNELKTTACLEVISNTVANHIDKAKKHMTHEEKHRIKTRDDKHVTINNFIDNK